MSLHTPHQTLKLEKQINFGTRTCRIGAERCQSIEHKSCMAAVSAVLPRRSESFELARGCPCCCGHASFDTREYTQVITGLELDKQTQAESQEKARRKTQRVLCKAAQHKTAICSGACAVL